MSANKLLNRKPIVQVDQDGNPGNVEIYVN